MSNTFEPLYLNIRTVLVEARRRTYQAVNSEMVDSYWHIGRMIVEEDTLPIALKNRK